MDKNFWRDTGFKGAWLTFILNLFGAQVTGYALEPPTNPNLFSLIDGDKISNSIIGDIRDFTTLKKSFDECKPEIVFHLAAQPIVLESYKNPAATYEINVMGTVNILECVKNNSSVKKFTTTTNGFGAIVKMIYLTASTLIPTVKVVLNLSRIVIAEIFSKTAT